MLMRLIQQESAETRSEGSLRTGQVSIGNAEASHGRCAGIRLKGLRVVFEISKAKIGQQGRADSFGHATERRCSYG